MNQVKTVVYQTAVKVHDTITNAVEAFNTLLMAVAFLVLAHIFIFKILVPLFLAALPLFLVLIISPESILEASISFVAFTFELVWEEPLKLLVRVRDGFIYVTRGHWMIAGPGIFTYGYFSMRGAIR